jgi:hypothetical protein
MSLLCGSFHKVGGNVFKLLKFRQILTSKNMISTSTKFHWIFHGKNRPNSPDFKKKEKEFQLPDFYDKFQYVAKNIEGSCF